MPYWCNGGEKKGAEEPRCSQRALEEPSWWIRSQKYNCLNYSGMKEKRSWGTSGHEFEEAGSEKECFLDDRSINGDRQEARWGEVTSGKVVCWRALQFLEDVWKCSCLSEWEWVLNY